MKIVVSNSQVAHLWANQSQDHARSDSMSFRGRNLYSYSTCIAAIHGHCALLNSRKYSATTSSKHMPKVRDALRGLAFATFTVPEVHNAGDGIGLGSRGHTINISYLRGEYFDYAKKLMRVQTLSDWQREELFTRAHAAQRYAAEFGLNFGADLYPQSEWDAAAARQLRLANDPKRQQRIAARERAAAAREQRAAVARVTRQAEYLAGFRANAPGYYNGLTDQDGAAYLRVTLDGEQVQTSRGAYVPVADAIRAISFIRAVKYLRKSDWKRDGEQCPVGKFQIDRISANGDIHAGCHFIKWSEIEATATALGMDGTAYVR